MSPEKKEAALKSCLLILQRQGSKSNGMTKEMTQNLTLFQSLSARVGLSLAD
jgi:hypothetical protein